MHIYYWCVQLGWASTSHLSFLSKLTEQIVETRFADNLSSSHLLNIFQSACSKFNSTETIQIAVYNHTVQAMGQQKVTAAFCLLDLSAAFDIQLIILYFFIVFLPDLVLLILLFLG
jgi:hypothetical protein